METALLIARTIDKILQNAVVRWLLLAAMSAATIYALWCRGQIGIVALQRDAAKSQASTYLGHLENQNAAILKAGQEAAAQKQKIADAAASADQLRKEAAEWRRKALNTPLTGTCDDMVDQVIQAVKE